MVGDQGQQPWSPPSAMRVFMAMNAEIFPVGTISRIVVIVAVNMMHGQLARSLRKATVEGPVCP